MKSPMRAMAAAGCLALVVLVLASVPAGAAGTSHDLIGDVRREAYRNLVATNDGPVGNEWVATQTCVGAACYWAPYSSSGLVYAFALLENWPTPSATSPVGGGYNGDLGIAKMSDITSLEVDLNLATGAAPGAGDAVALSWYTDPVNHLGYREARAYWYFNAPGFAPGSWYHVGDLTDDSAGMIWDASGCVGGWTITNWSGLIAACGDPQVYRAFLAFDGSTTNVYQFDNFVVGGPSDTFTFSVDAYASATPSSVGQGDPVSVAGRVYYTDTTASGYFALDGAAFPLNGLTGAEVSLDGGTTWTSTGVTADDGTFDGAEEEVSASVTAPTTPGSYQVCLRGVSATGEENEEVCASLTVLDTAGPDITITTPADGGAYERGSSVTADYACSDVSGVASCDGTVADGSPVNTSVAGHYTFTVDAEDTLGNPSSASVEYDVTYNGCLIDENTATKTMTLLDDCTVDHSFVVPNLYTLDGDGYSLFAVDPSGGHFLGAVVKNGGSVANVQNLTVQTVGLSDTCDAGGDRLRGIMLDGASGQILDNTVSVGQGAGGMSGCQEGNAIETRNEPFTTAGPDKSVTIEGNTVTAYIKGGIVANGSVAATILNNTITGWGPVGVPYAAQNGIQIGFGGTATIRGNSVSGNAYTPKDWVACGLLYYLADGVRASSNALFGNERDVCNFGRGGGQFNPPSGP